MDNPKCHRFPPEERSRLRAEIERLQAEQVSEAMREESRRRRAVTVGRKQMETCGRDLRQAQLGWQALLAKDIQGRSRRQEEEEEDKKQLLALLDLGLVLLDRIEALERRGKRTKGRPDGAPGGRAAATDSGEEQLPPTQPLPTPEETPGGEEMGGAGRGRDGPGEPTDSSQSPGVPQEGGEEKRGDGEDPDDDDNDDDDDDYVDDADYDYYYERYLDDLYNHDCNNLDDDKLNGLRQRVYDLQESVKTLREDLEEFTNNQRNELSRLHEALRYRAGSSLEETLHGVKRKEEFDLETPTWKFKEALWRFLLSDSLEDLPAKMAAWKKEVEALQEKILRAIKRLPKRKQTRKMWMEMLRPKSRRKGFLKEAAGLHSAAADLEGALMEVLQEEEEEEEMVILWKRLAALRRGPLEAVGALEEKRHRLESALFTLFMKHRIPREEELLAVQEKATAIVNALNPSLLKEVGGLHQYVGAFLGVQRESSGEILVDLPFLLREKETLGSSANDVKSDLWGIIFSRHMKSPQKKVRALPQRLGDLNRVLMISRQQEVLEDISQNIPDEELDILKEKLRVLTEVLQKKEEALKIAILNEVEDIPEQGQTGMSLPTPSAPPEPIPESTAPTAHPQGGEFSSGIPSNPGRRRSWHEELSQEERNGLIQRFAKAISRNNSNAKAPVKSQTRLEVLLARKVEEEMYTSAVNKDQYHDSLARKFLEIEKELEALNSPAHGVLGDPTRASWPPAAPTADFPPMAEAAVAGRVELGRPPGRPTLSAPRKSPPGTDEASTRLKVNVRQTSLPAGPDGANRLRSQDVQNPEERNQAERSEDALPDCRQNGTPVGGSKPPSKRQKMEG